MNTEKNILLLLSKGFEAYEASVFTDVIGWSNDVVKTSLKVTTVGTKDKIKATWNFLVTPDKLVSEVNVDDYDALAIPGGFGTAGFYEDSYSEPILELIKEFNTKNKIIATVCVGVLPLAKTGALAGRNATTYHLVNDGKRRQLAGFNVNVLDQHLVVDDNVISCSSPAYALDVAFELLEKMTSKEKCVLVKEAMGFV